MSCNTIYLINLAEIAPNLNGFAEVLQLDKKTYLPNFSEYRVQGLPRVRKMYYKTMQGAIGSVHIMAEYLNNLPANDLKLFVKQTKDESTSN